MDLIEKILEHLFGHKYYVNIINRRGTDACEMSSFIFPDKQSAIQHKQQLEHNTSFMYVETVSFRSYKTYKTFRP